MINLITNPDLCGHLLPYIPSNELDTVFLLNRVSQEAQGYLCATIKESYKSRKLSALNTYRWLESNPALRKFAALLKAKFLTVEEVFKLLDRDPISGNAFIIQQPDFTDLATLRNTMLHSLTVWLGRSDIFTKAKKEHREINRLSGQERVQWYIQNIFNKLTQTEKAGLKALIDDSINKRVPIAEVGTVLFLIPNHYLSRGSAPSQKWLRDTEESYRKKVCRGLRAHPNDFS